MSDDNINSAARSPLERHFQTLVQVVLVGICVWMATTVQDTAVKVATLTERVATLQNEVSGLRAGTALRYTSDDAARDLAAINSQLDDMRARIRDLERKEQ